MTEVINLLLSRTGTSCTLHPSSQGESTLGHVPPWDLGSQLCRYDSTCRECVLGRGCGGDQSTTVVLECSQVPTTPQLQCSLIH